MVVVSWAALFSAATGQRGTPSSAPASVADTSRSTGATNPADRDEPAADPAANDLPHSDVVVVGAGISGLTTAWELAQAGARVTVVDRSSVFGGHAVMSQGGLCIVGTPAQQSQGINDSPELAYRDFVRWGEDADVEWVRYYVDHSRREIYDWLIELGVEFESVLPAPGNSVARFHQPVGRGVGLVTPIYRECVAAQVQFVWNARATQLRIDQGRVVGVAVRNERTGVEQELTATAVVLATGGFQSNLDMVRQYWPAEFRFPERILIGSGLNSIGDGHRIAQRAGAELVKMDHQWNYFTGIPDPRYPDSPRGLSAANMYGILVNSQGHRFANLLQWAKEVMPALLQQDRATLWFIFDEASKPKFVVSGSDWADFDKVNQQILQNAKLVSTAATIPELAKKAGLPPEHLVETIRRYNAFVDAGEDRDFGRFRPGDAEAINMSPKIATPPYYAMQAFPITRKSMGGVAIDRRCRVLDRQGQVIPGLYAVGELTGLAGINGKAALEGTFLGPCVVTGRVAGREIARELSLRRDPEHQETSRCTDCHDLAPLLAQPRPGYWHFEQVHRVAVQRRIQCGQCHPELTPYRADRHRTDAAILAASCVQCHVAQE